MKCSANDCINDANTRGLCVKHYTRFIRYGNTDTVLKPRGEARKFFYSLLDRKDDDCISWPFTWTSRDKRPWVSLGKDRNGCVARFLCEEINGKPSFEKAHAAHNCGNHACVNPSHIRWATAKENAADKEAHGTVSRGEAHGASKLTEKDVLRIRELSGTMTKTEIAKLFGIGDMQVGRIIRRERWAHV